MQIRNLLTLGKPCNSLLLQRYRACMSVYSCCCFFSFLFFFPSSYTGCSISKGVQNSWNRWQPADTKLLVKSPPLFWLKKISEVHRALIGRSHTHTHTRSFIFHEFSQLIRSKSISFVKTCGKTPNRGQMILS